MAPRYPSIVGQLFYLSHGHPLLHPGWPRGPGDIDRDWFDLHRGDMRWNSPSGFTCGRIPPTPANPFPFRNHLRSLPWKTSVHEEVESELSFHVEMRTQELIGRSILAMDLSISCRRTMGITSPERREWCLRTGRSHAVARQFRVWIQSRRTDLQLDGSRDWRIHPVTNPFNWSRALDAGGES